MGEVCSGPEDTGGRQPHEQRHRESPTAKESPSPGSWARLQAGLFHPLALLTLLILATLVARARVLSTPIAGVRQTQTAMISDNLGRDLDELGPPALFYPRIDYAGDQPGYLLLEFPVMNLAGVFLARAFGLSREIAYRLPSLLLFAAMLPFFFAFVRARFGTMEAIVSTLLVAYFPVVVDQSMEPMPEQGAATAFVAGLYFSARHVEAGRSRHLVAAAVCFALMLLIKSTFVLLLLAPAGLLWGRGGKLGIRLGHVVAGVSCFVPLSLWLAHASAVNRASVLDDGTVVSELVGNFLAQHGRWALLGTPGTYAKFWEMLSRAYGSWPLLLLAAGSVYGLIRCRGNRVLLAAWLAAFLLFFVAVPFNASNHSYYTHGYATLIAIAGAVLLCAVVRSGAALVPRWARPSTFAALAALALAFVVQARWETTPLVHQRVYEFGQALQRVASPRALGIISTPDRGVWDGELLYASNTRGWRSILRKGPSRRELSLEFIEEKRLRGAEFLAHYGRPAELAASKPELFRLLTEKNTVLAKSPEWIVFSLVE